MHRVSKYDPYKHNYNYFAVLPVALHLSTDLDEDSTQLGNIILPSIVFTDAACLEVAWKGEFAVTIAGLDGTNESHLVLQADISLKQTRTSYININNIYSPGRLFVRITIQPTGVFLVDYLQLTRGHCTHGELR